VSGYAGSCPSCGAEVVFRLGHSLLKVCEHCGSAVARKGANLASYGKVAALVPTTSILQLGVRGDYAGAPPFTLIGHLQLDWGSGAWDEWLMAFESGATAWLSESQGRFHYLAEAPLPPVPAFSDLSAGATIDLGPPGTFVVTEVRSARFATAEGELPFDIEPGRELNYADLSGPGGQFGTLDYGTGQEAEALYVGREVHFEELGLVGLPKPEERHRKTRTEALSCTQCGGPLEIRAPDQTQRIACPYCGSLLDATRDLAVLAALGKPPVEPLIPLGAEGRLHGVEWTVIGFLERSVTVEGIRYPWHEYLLYEPRAGFRWLVESSGHWTFVEQVNAGDVQAWRTIARWQGLAFKHFQTAVATIDHVIGEFYWAIAVGDAVEAADHVDPPRILSREQELVRGEGGRVTPGEITWSVGTYVEPGAVWTAFHPPLPPPARKGVGANQPSPYAGKVAGLWGLGLLAAAAAFFVFLVIYVSGRTVLDRRIALPPGARSGTPETAVFLGPFAVENRSNVRVKVTSDVDNSWLYLDGALYDDETGALDEFDVEVSYYHGRDSDGSWSEGSRRASAFVSEVPPGRYTLRLAPQWEMGKQPSFYEVTVRSRVPRLFHLFLVLIALLSWPALASWRYLRFEAGRWAESDHPWGQSQ